MTEQDRREFLKRTGALIAATSVYGTLPTMTEGSPAAGASAAIPPHRSQPLVGVHAYTDRLSIPAGETIRIHASATIPYELQVCRLGLDVDSPDQDVVLRSWKVDSPVMQPIHPGSYVHVDKGLDDRPLQALTLECWVRLWDLPGEAALLGQFDRTQSAGYALSVKRDGSLGFYLGDGGPVRIENWHFAPAGTLTRTQTSPPSVPGLHVVANGGRGVTLAKWHHVVATWNGESKELWVDGKRVGQWKQKGTVRPGISPLRLGAWGQDGLADGFLDADMAMPAIYGRALAETEIRERFAAQALKQPAPEQLLGCWTLAEERGDRLADCSGNERHGRIINHGTWMIGGPAFNANVERCSDYDPVQDATRGHGLRLASDDLYDCRWEPTFEFAIPSDSESGIYAARFRFERNGEPRLYHALYIVKRAVGTDAAPIAFLCSTNSWRAYSGTPFAETWPGIAETIGHAYVNSAGDPPNFCFYWQHKAGQGSYQMGLRMPWPVAGPYTFHQDLAWRCSHLCHADRLTLTWLEREGYGFDTYSDLDLHQNSRLLDGYKTVFIVGHSEYWSAEGWNALRRYLERGGTVICLSGNTMFWRVSFNEDASIIECRKVDAPGAQDFPDRRGEIWHSHDGKRGGMSRECGYPAWQLLGLEYMSVHAVGVEGVGPYLTRAAEHPLFHEPHETGLKAGDKFGQSATGMPQLIGHEGDVRLSTLAKVCLHPLPPGANPPTEDPAGITLLADGFCDWTKVKDGAPWDYYQRGVVNEPQRSAVSVACEMILWDRPSGGRVFHAGSVSAGRGFANDPKFGLLMKNVLHHFGVPTPKPA